MDAALFDRYRDAWNNHDVDALVEFFTDDGVYEDATLARVNRGKAAIRAFAEEAFANSPDFHVEDSGLIIDPSGRFGVEWTMSGTHQGDTASHKFSVRGASAGEFEGDKIKRNSDYWNMAEFMAQVGTLPQPPSA
ncbi:MAG TPA: ester cyclase [Nocardioidaceae bacterium]